MATPALRILYVSTHDDTARGFDRLLSRFGHRLTIVGSGTEALRELSTWRHDLVLFGGSRLCDGDAHSFMPRVRREFELPGILLSAHGMTDDVLRSVAAGFAAHLIKPVEVNALLAVLADVAAERGNAPGRHVVDPANACPDCRGRGTIPLFTGVAACDCRDAATRGVGAELAGVGITLSVRTLRVLHAAGAHTFRQLLELERAPLEGLPEARPSTFAELAAVLARFGRSGW
ncbi:MAG TPA: hypothetical protein VF796_05640 [Humisphaera sp.]